jgi:hypothetical protein
VREWHVGTCLAVPRREREPETSLLTPAPLLPTWEKGLGDEGNHLPRFKPLININGLLTPDGLMPVGDHLRFSLAPLGDDGIPT